MVGRSTVVVTAESQAQLQQLAGSEERGEADRARAILLSVAGWSSGRIGEAFGVREDTVRLWRMRFMQGGVAGLRRHSPPGASPLRPAPVPGPHRGRLVGAGGEPQELDVAPPSGGDRATCGYADLPLTALGGAA